MINLSATERAAIRDLNKRFDNGTRTDFNADRAQAAAEYLIESFNHGKGTPDSKLTFKEYQAQARKFGLDPSRAAFEKADRSGDGLVDVAELGKKLTGDAKLGNHGAYDGLNMRDRMNDGMNDSMATRLEDAVDDLMNGDKKLSKREFKDVSRGTEFEGANFDDIDTSGNEFIDEKEAAQYLADRDSALDKGMANYMDKHAPSSMDSMGRDDARVNRQDKRAAADLMLDGEDLFGNTDGKLDSREFKTVSKGTEFEGAKFRDIDKNHDGLINAKEAAKYLASERNNPTLDNKEMMALLRKINTRMG